MDPGVTLLLFSRNDTSLAEEVITEMKEIVNEIVVIDSSDEPEHRDFAAWSQEETKVNLEYVPALGYPDLLRPYALGKCRNDWVLLLDTDERSCQLLKDDLKKIIDSNKSEVYAIDRYSGSRNGVRFSNARSAQVRLFNKNFLNEKGIMHKLPTSNARFTTLPKKYYITHLIREKVNRIPEYSKIDQFSRLTFDDLPIRVRKFFRILETKDKISRNLELSNASYFILYLMKESYSALITKNPLRLARSVSWSFKRLIRIIGMKKRDRNNVYFNISKLINKHGMVEFLHFDSPSVVNSLNDLKKKWNVDGSTFLIRLLLKQYGLYCLEKARNSKVSE